MLVGMPTSGPSPTVPGLKADVEDDLTGDVETAVAKVRALHPAWPATLIREVALRSVGVAPVVATADPSPLVPPPDLTAALSRPATLEAFGEAETSPPCRPPSPGRSFSGSRGPAPPPGGSADAT